MNDWLTQMNVILVTKRIQTYTNANNKCGMTPKCSLRRSLGSVAVQNSASKVSWPKAENKRSPTSNML